MIKIAIFVFLCICVNELHGQNFSGRTNDLNVNFKQPPTVKTSLPVIRWIVPKTDDSNSQLNVVEIEAEVISDIPLRAVELLVGLSGQSKLSKNLPFAQNATSCRARRTIRLMDGHNEIELSAENVEGGKVFSTRFILVGKEAIADAVDINRSDYALIIATNKYDDWDDLVNPVGDARAIEGLLKEKYGFKTEFMEDPTYEDIYAKISEYNTRRFRPQDQLFVFFAGHGTYDENLKEGFVAAKNSLRNDRGRTTYIPHSILRQRLDNIKCEHIFLVMDVCFGGTFDPVLAKSRGLDPYVEQTDQQVLVRKLSTPTRKFLTSGSKEYVSDGIPGKHSPFAAQFIKALKETGGKGGRLLTLYDLIGYFDRLSSVPRFGKFSDKDDTASDFVFVTR